MIGGSDYPIEDLAPLVGLQRLVATEGDIPTLPLDRALGLMCDGAAGTTVLSDDPHGVAEDELAAIEVVETRPAG